MKSVSEIENLPPWIASSGPEGDVVMATRVRLARCLSGHMFPMSASLMQRTNIFLEITAALRKLSLFRKSEAINFMQCERDFQEVLAEKRFASRELLSAEGDRGVAVASDSRISVMINEEDHLRMQCMDAGFKPVETWKNINDVDDSLGESLTYAYDVSRGFLTSCPANSGTGLRVSFLLHLPGLILAKSVDQTLTGASQMGITVRGFSGENTDAAGSFFQLSNQASLGAPEKEFLTETGKIIERVISCEREARRRILKDAKVELTDRVYRAWGILMYARTLSVDELLNLCSAVRTGVECGIFDKVTTDKLNRALILGMPAHLKLLKGAADDGLSAARAELTREILCGADYRHRLLKPGRGNKTAAKKLSPKAIKKEE
jgi:protein arginine kinase